MDRIPGLSSVAGWAESVSQKTIKRKVSDKRATSTKNGILGPSLVSLTKPGLM